MDYGNKDSVSFANIRPLDPKFRGLSGQAHDARLRCVPYWYFHTHTSVCCRVGRSRFYLEWVADDSAISFSQTCSQAC